MEVLKASKQFGILTQNDKDLAVCFIGAKLKEYDDGLLKIIVHDLILSTYKNVGFEYKEDFVNETIDDFVKDLQMFAGAITFNELEFAFKNGYMHKYGSFTGLNNSTYWKWVNTYIQDIRRVKLRSMLFSTKPQPEQKKISEEEANEIIRKGIVDKFNTFKSSGSFMDAGNVAYKYLKEKGKINLSDHTKGVILKQVKDRLRQEALQERGTKPLKKALDEALDQSRISIEVKKAALKKYFQNLIEMGIDIKEELA